MSVRVEYDDRVTIVTIDRPAVRNAVDGATARALAAAFRAFDEDPEHDVAVLAGAGETFCAGADLRAFAADPAGVRLEREGDAPMGCTRMLLSKPVIAAIAGHAVAGGLELALWCDLRVADETAVFGVYCRRFGVPLIDGGTVRLPRIVGQSRALDMILTGRSVGAHEALEFGLANRVVPAGHALAAARVLAHELARFPQTCLRSDRLAAYEGWSRSTSDAMRGEFERGLQVLESGEPLAGAKRFAGGQGRHGAP